MKERIYLDHNASAPVDSRVIEAIQQYLTEVIGNPSSIHSFGREARQCLTKSRDSIAAYLGVSSEEVVFTSGGTEGANLVIRGLFDEESSGHIITSGVEHSCVFNTVKLLEKRGCEVTYLSPGAWGAVKPEAIQEAIRPDTKLIAIMAANNETGVKSDVEAIASIAEGAGISFFVDAVVLLGREEIQIPEGVSAMAFSGQKIHATKGVGFCFIRKKLKLSPLICGGEQQGGRRAGTENLPGIVGMAKAVSLLNDELPLAIEKMADLRGRFERGLMDSIEGVVVNGEGPRVVNTSNLCFTGIDGETLLSALDMEGIAASHGSACTSGAFEPSRVLLNMDLPRDRVMSSLRFSLSRFMTEVEIEAAVNIIIRVVNRLRRSTM